MLCLIYATTILLTLIPECSAWNITAPITSNGTCGIAFNGTICGNWPNGGCCSLYGWCGNTTYHCGVGCQSGPCFGNYTQGPPGPEMALQNLYPGSFQVVGESGVPAMHAALMPNGRVVFLDKVENYTQLTLPNGQYAYSAEYDPANNTVVPLSYETNAFCAGGIFLANGTLISVGGNDALPTVDSTVGSGFKGIRYLTRSSTDSSLDGQSWVEPGNKLSSARWYASTQILSDGSIIVASGSLNGNDPSDSVNNNPTYEILNPNGSTNNVSIPMAILEHNQPYFMYPFLHLLPNGQLFIFVSRSSQVFSVESNTTVKTLPDLPGDYRTYPNTGGSVLLPLSSANNYTAEILICGGGPFQDISSPTDASCGRITPLAANATWDLDAMPEGRIMVEGILLPDGTTLFLNGAHQGSQGFGDATDPTLEVLIYDPSQPLGERWSTGASSTIPRLYHSTALLLLDGTVMVAGSNPNEMPVLQPTAWAPYQTEFRVEIYTPPYLSQNRTRPTNVTLSTTTLVPGNGTFDISFSVPENGAEECRVVLYYGGFVTHSLHMGQRMVYLDFTGFVSGEKASQTLRVSMPPSYGVAPPGPYVVYVVVDTVPAVGQFVMVA